MGTRVRQMPRPAHLSNHQERKPAYLAPQVLLLLLSPSSQSPLVVGPGSRFFDLLRLNCGAARNTLPTHILKCGVSLSQNFRKSKNTSPLAFGGPMLVISGSPRI